MNTIGKDNLYHLISSAPMLHSQNPLQTEFDWISDYNLEPGGFDIAKINPELCSVIPSCSDMGKVYARLVDFASKDYVEGLLEVYNSAICSTIDHYNSSAFYEPSYVIFRAYRNNGF